MFILLVNISYGLNIREKFNGTSLNNDFANVSSRRTLPFDTSNSNFTSTDTGYRYFTWQAGVTAQINKEGWQTTNWFNPVQYNSINISIDGFTNIIGYKTEFTNPFIISENTTFILYYNSTPYSTSWTQWFLWLLDENGRENLSLAGGSYGSFGTLSFCGGTYVPLVAGSCRNPVTEITPTALRLHNTTQYIIDLGNASIPNDVYYGLAIGFLKGVVSPDSIILGGYDLLNIGNGTNLLPTGTFEFNKSTLCINKTDTNPSATFQILNDITDPEGDQIYYDTELLTNIKVNKTIDYNTVYCILGQCVNRPDYSFMSNVYYPTYKTCIVEDNRNNIYPIVNNSNHNLLDSENGEYSLNMNGYCSGTDKSFYYDFEKSYDKLFYTSEFIGVFNNDLFNITLYDNSFLTDVVKLNVNVTNNNVNISYFDGNSFILLGNVTNTNYVNITIFFDTVTNNANVSLNGNFFNVPLLNNNSLVRFIGIRTKDNSILIQKQFTYGGINQDIDFTTGIPTGVTVHNTGTYEYSISYTDAVNKPDYFNTQTLQFNVVSCDEYIDYENLGTIKGKNVYKGLTAFKDSITNVCTSLDNSLEVERYGFCFFIRFGYVFFAILLSYALGLVFLSLSQDVGFIVITFSFYLMIKAGSYILPFGITLRIISALVGIFGIIAIFRLLFTSNSSAGVEG